MSSDSFPEQQSWTVKVAKFTLPGEDAFAENAHIAVKAEPAGGFTLTVTDPAGNVKPFRCTAQGDQLRFEEDALSLLVRPLRSPERLFLAGAWFRRDGRGDTPVGTWTAEDDTIDDES
jgi:hypothetical protein